MRNPVRVGRGFSIIILALFLLGRDAVRASGQTVASGQESLPRPAKIDPYEPLHLGFAQKAFPKAMVGIPYHSSVQAVGGWGWLALSVTGDLPPGLVLETGSNTVAVTGVPSVPGTYTLEISAQDLYGNTAKSDFTIDVSAVVPGSSASVSPTVTDNEGITFTDVESVFFPAKVIDNETITLTDTEKGLDAVVLVDRETITLTDVETGLDSALTADSENITLTDAESIEVLTATNIIWPTPAPITYGTPLSGTQLDASVPTEDGSFVYSPPAGTILPGGLNTLSVTFTPSAANQYAPATATVQLTVNQASQAITFTDSLPASAPYSAGLSYTLSANGGGSGKPVTFSLVSGPATVNGSTLAIIGGGNVVIAANQAGNANYAAAPQATQSIVITQPASLTSPTPGSALTGSSATFNWSAGVGVTKYEFLLGTTGPGSDNLDYLASATALSSGLVSNIPTNGMTLYARLYSLIGGVWQHTDYTYTELGPASLISPAPGSTLTGSTATFGWTTGGGVTKYEFLLGTTGPGSDNLDYLASATALSSGLVSDIPTNGMTLYARLYSLIGGVWQHTDYTYTEAGTPVPAALISPAPGSTLTGSTATFGWTAGGGVTKYEFLLGTTGPGSDNLDYLASATALSSGLVSNIPTYGATLYARLYSLINGVWQYTDYTYTESGAPVPAALTSPAPGSTLTGSSATFNWTAGGGVTKYEFLLGTKGKGSDDLDYLTSATALSSGLVSNIPTTGGTLYARLYSLMDGVWQYTDYTYTEQ